MTRARLDESGPAFAKAGYDIDTAPLSQKFFAPGMVALRLRLIGTVTTAPYSGDAYDGVYDRAIDYFGFSFPKPPLVLYAGRISATESDQSCHELPAFLQVLPTMMVMSFVDRVEVCREKFGLAPATIKYFAFANTLED